MNEAHQPRPEFVSFLEWQVQTAFQRRGRFTSPARRSPWLNVKVAALILVSIFCGAAGVTARDQIQESKNKEILLAQIETRIRLAEMRLEFTRTHLERIKEQQEAHLISEEEATSVMTALREAEVEHARLHLDFEEVRITGEEPKNGLTAPLVGDRDFVTERLKLDLSVATAQASAVQKRLERVRTLEKAGAITATEAMAVMAEFNEAVGHAREVEQKIALRQRFLKGELSADQVENEVERNRIAFELELEEARLLKNRLRQDRIQQLVESGVLNEIEMQRINIELFDNQATIRLLQLELERYLRATHSIPPDRP